MTAGPFAFGCLVYVMLCGVSLSLNRQMRYHSVPTYFSAFKAGLLAGAAVVLSRCVADAAQAVSIVPMPAGISLSDKIGVAAFCSLPVLAGFSVSFIFTGVVASPGTFRERVARFLIAALAAVAGCLVLFVLLKHYN